MRSPDGGTSFDGVSSYPPEINPVRREGRGRDAEGP